MFCLCNNLSITKPILITNATLPQNPDSPSSSPKQTNLPPKQKPSLSSKNSTTSIPPNKLPRRPSPSSLMQIERALGAGSFRDGEPDLKMKNDSDVKKTTMDLFLGQVFEGTVQKKLRETGEWLGENGETRFRSTNTSIVHCLSRDLQVFGYLVQTLHGANPSKPPNTQGLQQTYCLSLNTMRHLVSS